MASLEGSAVVVKWNPVAAKIPLAGYLVYRAFPGDDTGTSLTPSPTKDTAWKDRTAQAGKTYLYWIVAQTTEGAKSSASAKAKVDVPGAAGGSVPFF